MHVGKLVDLVPPTRRGRALAAVSLVDATGTGFFLAGSAVFFVRVLGLSASQVGVGLAIAGSVGFLTTVPLGMLADRVGHQRMLVLLHLWRGVCMTGLAFADSMTAFVLVSSLVAIADCAVMPLTRSLVSDAMGEDERTRMLGFMRSWRNAGFALGAAACAPLIAADSHLAYTAIIVVNAVSYLVAAVVIGRLKISDATSVGPALPGHPASSAPERAGISFPRALLDRPYVALTLLDAALMTHITLLTLGLPLWIAEHTDVPVVVIPVLVVLNTTLAVALQVRFASGGEAPRTARRRLERAGVCLAICCFLIAATANAPVGPACCLLVAAVLALTAGELWEAAGSWALSYRFAAPDREAEYLSVFSLGSTAQSIVAPLVITALVLDGGWLGWTVLGAVFVGLAIAIRPVVRLLECAHRLEMAESTAKLVDSALVDSALVDSGGATGGGATPRRVR